MMAEPLRFWPADNRRRRRRRWRWARWLVVAALLALWALTEWQRANRPPARVEPVAERFTLCGKGRAHGCVIDGDTFRLGERKIRIEGIDAPEMEGRCPAERLRAARSRERLLALLAEGPFTMTARTAGARDQYGRELWRIERDGRDLGEALVAEGLAHEYRGKKLSWC